MLSLLVGGPWNTFASISFFLSALFSDILALRIVLMLAYVFLFVGALCGWPAWPNFGPTGTIAVSAGVLACWSLWLVVYCADTPNATAI